MINNSLKTIILAAGESKRILSSKPKILHTIGGKTILQHVLDNIEKVVSKKNINIVINPKLNQLKNEYKKINFSFQKKPLGTAHVVLSSKKFYSKSNQDILIIFADNPFIDKKIVENMIDLKKKKNSKIVLLNVNKKKKTEIKCKVNSSKNIINQVNYTFLVDIDLIDDISITKNKKITISDVSLLDIFNKNKKIARYLSEYIFYEFSKYISGKYIINLEEKSKIENKLDKKDEIGDLIQDMGGLEIVEEENESDDEEENESDDEDDNESDDEDDNESDDEDEQVLGQGEEVDYNNLEKYILPFFENKVENIINYDYDIIDQYFVTDSGIMKDNKIIIAGSNPEETNKRLKYVLYLKIKNKREYILNYYKQTYMNNYFVDITDYNTSAPGQTMTLSGFDSSDDGAILKITYAVKIGTPVNRDKFRRASRLLKVGSARADGDIHYGTCYDDKEITLGVPHVHKIHGIYESTDGTPLPPSGTLTVVAGTTVNDEIIVGQTSGARARVIRYNAGGTTYFYYINNKRKPTRQTARKHRRRPM